MKVIVSPRARDDLVNAYDHIAQDNPGAADRLLARFTKVVDLLAEEWMRGREVRLRNGQMVRTWPVAPYRIYYRVHNNELEILRFYHQARRPIEE